MATRSQEVSNKNSKLASCSAANARFLNLHQLCLTAPDLHVAKVYNGEGFITYMEGPKTSISDVSCMGEQGTSIYKSGNEKRRSQRCQDMPIQPGLCSPHARRPMLGLSSWCSDTVEYVGCRKGGAQVEPMAVSVSL